MAVKDANLIIRGDQGLNFGRVVMAGGLSPGRATSATGYVPGELTDGIRNNIIPPDEGVKFRSGGPSSEELVQAIRKTIETPEDPLEVVKGVTDPSIQSALSLAHERRTALKSRLSWVLPQYEWMKDNPLTLAVYRSAELYTEGMERDLNRWFSRLEALELDKVDPRWKNKLADVVEKKITGNVPEDIKQKAQGIRELLDEAYDWAKEQGININYRENYFPHIFDGDIRVQVGRRLITARADGEVGVTAP